MTLREFLVNNKFGFQRQDSDEVIVNNNLDFNLVPITETRLPTNTIVEINIDKIFVVENTKSICFYLRKQYDGDESQ